MKPPDDSDPKSLSHRLRKKRFRLIEQIIKDLTESRKYIRILDVGGRAQYWRLMDKKYFSKVQVTLLNLESDRDFRDNAPIGLEVLSKVGNACDMSQIDNREYDLCHSNSVIEHVGSLKNMALFADETSRVASAYYHQTPNLFFPIEPHYGVPLLHWLPGPLRASLTTRYKVGFGIKPSDFREALEIIDNIEIVTPGLMRRLFPDGKMDYERFMFLPKSIIVRRW